MRLIHFVINIFQKCMSVNFFNPQAKFRIELNLVSTAW